MAWRRRVAPAVAAALTCGVAVICPASAAPLLEPTAATSVSCLPSPHAVTPEQREALFALARAKLGAAVPGSVSRYPFGALRAEPDYARAPAQRWSSGFFAGELWLMYAKDRTPQWLAAARAYTKGLIKIANYRDSHDLGFIVGVPAGLGAALDPSPAQRAAYVNARIMAARTLALRWNPNVKALKSAEYQGKWGLIIDSSMNAPLLIEVGQLIGGPEGERLATYGTEHMLTLAHNFIRPDGSTFHRMAFNPRTGALIGPVSGQGLDAQASTWARGQAWAINGFTRAYELTGNPELLAAATRLAGFWVAKVPPGCIPAWDFDIANARAPRDSSAAAIAADAMVDLRRAAGPSLERFGAYADTSLGLLTTPWLTTAHSVNPGLLLQQTLNVPNDPREGSYVWGDFYLLRALSARPADELPAQTVGSAAIRLMRYGEK